MLASLSLSHPQSVESAVSLFYENFWVHYNEPVKPENTLAIVRTIVGSEEEAKKVIDSTKSEEVKKKLASNTDQAFKDGAFGLPWFVGKFCAMQFLMGECYVKRSTNVLLQQQTRRVRVRVSGVWTTWLNYVTIWVLRDLVVKDGELSSEEVSHEEVKAHYSSVRQIPGVHMTRQGNIQLLLIVVRYSRFHLEYLSLLFGPITCSVHLHAFSINNGSLYSKNVLQSRCLGNFNRMVRQDTGPLVFTH